MEEATGGEYSNLIPEHRARGARWLAQVHSAASAGAAQRLPDRGPDHYRRLVDPLRETMRRHLDNPVLTADDVTFLEGLLADLPRTLVHGDFNGRNIRLPTINGDDTLAVFDWEEAGWGVPAVDLAQQLMPSGQLSANPDIPTYWSTGRAYRAHQSLERCWRLAYCGTVFRALSAMSWIIDDLANDWAHACLGDMRLYAAELEGALERLDWGRPAPPPPREVGAT
jgi:aminoglycoside phosphotransferase (APT) family kinase protein